MRRLASLLDMEARRILRFPVIELIAALATFLTLHWVAHYDVYMQVPGGVARGEALARVLRRLLADQSRRVTWRGGFALLASYEFAVLAYVALASATARDLSTGYMRLLLSLPFRRGEVFLVRASLTLLPPLLALLASNAVASAVVAHLCACSVDPRYALICYLPGVVSCVYIFSVSLSIALASKDTVTSVIASLLFLYGSDFALRGLYRSPLSRLLPPACLTEFAFAAARGRVLWESLLCPLAASAALLTICYFYFTRWLEL